MLHYRCWRILSLGCFWMVSLMHLQICCMLDLTSKALLVELLVFIQIAIPKVGNLERKLSIFLSERKLLSLLKRNLGNLTKKCLMFQNTWAYCFPWAKTIVRDNSLISQVWCTTCNNVESKMKLLSTKLYTFQKHVDCQKPIVFSLGVVVEDYFYS